MKRIKAASNADAAQLRQELAGQRGVSVVEEGGDVLREFPDEADEFLVRDAVRRHFPRSLLKAVADLDFDSIDYAGATTLAQFKVEAEKHRRLTKQLQTFVVRALRARWE